MAKIILVELTPDPRWSRHSIFRKRRWWPVYASAHTDPSLGTVGAIRHYHLALNRLPEKFVRKNPRLRNIAAIAVEDILGYRTKERPIISGPWKAVPTFAQRLAMIAAWKKRLLARKVT